MIRSIAERTSSRDFASLIPFAIALCFLIGAGVAGLTVAGELAKLGHDVTIFEAHPYAGGMVGGAIPEYRIPQSKIDQDLQVLHDLGGEVRTRWFSLSAINRSGKVYDKRIDYLWWADNDLSLHLTNQFYK